MHRMLAVLAGLVVDGTVLCVNDGNAEDSLAGLVAAR